MAVKQWSKFEKVALAWLCFAIAVLLLTAYLESLPGQSSDLIQAVGMIGLWSALIVLAVLAILGIRKVSVIGVVLAVAIGALCYYLSVAFPSLRRYPLAGVLAVWLVIRENEELKKYDTLAAKIFFIGLGYLYGLMIRAARWVREAFSSGVTAALQNKDARHKDDSSKTR
jgi:hypothetical protein